MYLTANAKRIDSGQHVHFAQSDQSVSVSLVKFIRAGNLKVKAKICDRTAQPNLSIYNTHLAESIRLELPSNTATPLALFYSAT